MILYDRHIPCFFKSVSSIFDLPCEELSIEIACIGYSNSGKSSAINAMTNIRRLTKVSRIPGSTKCINFFKVNSCIRLVDFPGYGYSTSIRVHKEYWYNVIRQYLRKRKNLKGLILVMDIRHIIKYLDQQIIKYASGLNIPILALLNKSDKISKDARQIKLNLFHNEIKRILLISQSIQIEIFSSIRKYRIIAAKEVFNSWLSHNSKNF